MVLEEFIGKSETDKRLELRNHLTGRYSGVFLIQNRNSREVLVAKNSNINEMSERLNRLAANLEIGVSEEDGVIRFKAKDINDLYALFVIL